VTRRVGHDDVDEIAVERCAAGSLSHTELTWDELGLVIRRLERTLPDTAIDRRIRASSGFTTRTRARRDWPRLVEPRRARQLTETDMRHILGYSPRRRTQ
jgi:hypothetical protein